jgi:hypothetical protein
MARTVNSGRLAFFWQCVSAPAKTVLAALSALGTATLIRDEFLPQYTDFHVWRLLPHWGLGTWIVVFLIAIVLAFFEGAYRYVRSLERVAERKGQAFHILKDPFGTAYVPDEPTRRSLATSLIVPGVIVLIVAFVWISSRSHYSWPGERQTSVKAASVTIATPIPAPAAAAPTAQSIPKAICADFEKVYYSEYEKELGAPSTVCETTIAYQAKYQYAHVLWLETFLGFYFLPTTFESKWRWHQDPDWASLGKQQFHPPAGLSAPRGGIASNWWEYKSLLGWLVWDCPRTRNPVYYQKFEKGFMVGIFCLNPSITTGEGFVLLNDRSWVSRLAANEAHRCD